MDQLHAMRVFIAVAEHRSFAEAARTLSMSRPAVTRAVAFLENKLDAELLVRTTRKVALSQVGARYVEDCRKILEAVYEADDAVAGGYTVPRGVLTITAPVLFGRLHITPLFHTFLQDEPAVYGRILLLDRVVDLIHEGVDVGVRIAHLQDSTQMAIRVGDVTPVLVAAPSYLEQHGAPRTVEDLHNHVLIAHAGSMRTGKWVFRGGKSYLLKDLKLIINDVHSIIDLARAGLGITLALSYQVASHLQNGTLSRVLSEWEPDPTPVHLVYPAGRRVPARTRAFLDFATHILRSRSSNAWML